jgi:hypothetical protein
VEEPAHRRICHAPTNAPHHKDQLLGRRIGTVHPGSANARRSPARLLAEMRVCGWSSSSTRRKRVRVSSSRSRACSCSPNARRSLARLLAEMRVCGWSSSSTRRKRVRVSSSRSRACSYSPNARRSLARLLAVMRVLGVVAQHPTKASQGVLVQVACAFVVTQRAQRESDGGPSSSVGWSSPRMSRHRRRARSHSLTLITACSAAAMNDPPSGSHRNSDVSLANTCRGDSGMSDSTLFTAIPQPQPGPTGPRIRPPPSTSLLGAVGDGLPDMAW